jgi:hypothetical protein
MGRLDGLTDKGKDKQMGKQKGRQTDAWVGRTNIRAKRRIDGQADRFMGGVD